MRHIKPLLSLTLCLFGISNPIWGQTHFPVTPSTTALWTFGAHSAGTFLDASPNSLSLTNANNFSLVSSPFDSAAVFTGTGSGSSSYVSHANTSLLNVSGTGKMTYEARVYLTQYPSTSNFNSQTNLMGNYDGMRLTIYSDGRLMATGQKTNGGANRWWLAASVVGAVPLNRWVDLAIAFDQSTGQAYGYIDGTPIQLYGTASTDLFRVPTTPFAIGNSTTDNQPFKGTIDEVRVSNTLVLGAGLPIIPEGSLPPGPPTGLSYSQSQPVYGVGVAITANNPTLTAGTSPITYSVTPALPSGLALNASTGVISGTPTIASAATFYTITATNSYGSTSASVNITVMAAPTSLSYSVNPARYAVGVAITPNSPTVSGVVTGYTVSPALPQGLTLNATTGVISGTPSAPSVTANYTVTASNAQGSTTTATVNITVQLSPSNLSYSVNPALYVTGTAATPNSPTIQGTAPITYSVTPALPAGLTLNTSTGTITGIPTTITAAANYVITASNAAGTTTATVLISVIPPLGVLRAWDSRTFTLKIAGSSAIVFSVPEGTAKSIKLEVLDMKGLTVWESRTNLEYGERTVIWNGRSNDHPISGGLYLARMSSVDARGNRFNTMVRRFVYSP